MTKYLLDTHTAIWALLGNDGKLSVKAKDVGCGVNECNV